MSEEIGRVVKVAGPVVDVVFPQDNLPELNFALEVDITIGDSKNTITLYNYWRFKKYNYSRSSTTYWGK